MGGFINPSTTIGGTAAAPGIPTAGSPTSGLYQTTSDGVGITVAGADHFQMNYLGGLLGLVSPLTSTESTAGVPGSPFSAGSPADMAVTPDGTLLYVGDGNSNNISAFHIAANGALTAVSGSPFSTVNYTYGVTISPDGAYLFTVSTSSSGVESYKIHSDGSLSVVAGSPFVSPGFAYNSVVTSDGRFLIVPSEQVGRIAVYSVSAGMLTQIAGSPFTSSNASRACISPDNNFVVISSNVAYINVFSLNQSSGTLSPVSGSPFLSPHLLASFGVQFSPSGNYLLTASYSSNSIVVYRFNQQTGFISNVPGSPFVTGTNPYAISFTPDGSQVMAANYGASTVSVMNFNNNTGALTNATGSPFAVGSAPYGVAVTPNGATFYVSNSTGNSISAFARALLPSINAGVPLLTYAFDPLGAFNGALNLNGALTLTGTLSSNGVYGTTTNDSAAVGVIGEYIDSTVLLAAAVNLTPNITTNVTSILLTPGDWDVEGIAVFHAASTTNVSYIGEGSSITSATFGPFGSYLTVSVASIPLIDTSYILPKTRYSIGVDTTVYLIALGNFTISTLSVYGHISARRVR